MKQKPTIILTGKKGMKIIKEELEKLLKEQDFDFTYEQLQEKLLSGYSYSITGGRINLYTGIGGVKLYIESSKKNGIPAIICAKSIIVSTDEGSQNLYDIKVKKLNNGQ